MVTFDSAQPGTSRAEWDANGGFDAIMPLDLAGIERITVIAAHPDDETLGAGGLLTECAKLGIPTQVIVVTDGAGSHPRSTAVSRGQLAVIRQRELFLAISELAPEGEVIMLGFADGETDVSRAAIAEALRRAIVPGSTLVSPWAGDGHRDHRVVAEVCIALAAERHATLLAYPIWMWHWASPGDESVPWPSAVSLALSDSTLEAKRRAISRHVSQVVGVGGGDGEGPVIAPDFAAHFDRDRELFFVPVEQPSAAKDRAYFDALYAENRDPWRLGTRWYEERKRAITVAALPLANYRSGLEIGCSTGELTAQLAPRCESMLAIDISAAAVESASRRTRELGNVHVEWADATARFPDGQFDLVVLSEVAYYWDRPTLRSTIAELKQHLHDDATLVVCHWRHPVADYPLRGDDVNELIRNEIDLPRVALHVEDDFLLEVFATDARSVAAREGLA